MLRVSLANDVREVRRINHALGDFLAEEGVPGRTIHHVRLVVEELVVNVVRYAYDDKVAHKIGVDVRTEPRRVVVTIEDDGRPFNPNDAPPPELRVALESRRVGGLGIRSCPTPRSWPSSVRCTTASGTPSNRSARRSG